ncbi:unnamed protein product [Closterium sp. NIES-64]|nr:unnamed protein product [Closterium sp. NIES-64]
MLGEMHENDMFQHQLGHPLEKRWVYPWEEEDEVPAVYAEPTQIELPAAREEAAVNKKREDLDWVEEAIERQRSRESYEREFGSGEFALMAAMKEVGAETKTQGERSQEKAQGQPTEPAEAEGPHFNNTLERVVMSEMVKWWGMVGGSWWGVEWQRRKAHQPSLYNGSKFRYGGFSLQPPSSTASPSAFAASEAAEAVEQGVSSQPTSAPTGKASLHLPSQAALLPSASEHARGREWEQEQTQQLVKGRVVMEHARGPEWKRVPGSVGLAGKLETGDRMAACATCQQAIGQRDAQACQHMGDALGNAALVVTADGCFLLLQRGTAVGEFPNCPVFPGGHPEPSEAGISDTPQSPPAQHHPTDPQSSTTPASPPLSSTNSPSSSPSLHNATIAHEMFEGMKREVEEENSAPADSLVSSPPHTPHPLLTLSLSLSQSLAPSPLAPASPSSSPSLLNATIAHEMFEGMKGEVEEETGAPANSLAQGEHAIARHVPLPHCTTHTNGCSCSPPCLPPPFSFSPQHGMLFLGLCRRRENVRSLAMFLCHTSLTAPEVLSCYASAQRKFESTSLRAMPLVRGGMCWYVCAMPPFLCLHLCAAQI